MTDRKGIYWQIGVVVQTCAVRGEIQEALVKLENGKVENALHYTSDFAELQIGDQVLLNTTAVQLSLSSGGFHFVHAVLGRGKSSELNCDVKVNMQRGHLMKLKYTSLQRSILAAEEPDSPHHQVFLEERNLEGMPVLLGELHSMLPIAAGWLHYRQGGMKIAYIMSDGGALPLAYSMHAATLKQLGWICGTVTYGQAYGGDIETLNKYTALLAAKHITGANLAIVCMGPGIAGTGTLLGHTGIEVGELVNAVSSLGGKPVVIPRISGLNNRLRHYGISHHVIGCLSRVAVQTALLPLPKRLHPDLSRRIELQLETYRTDLARHKIIRMDIAEDRIKEACQRYPYPVKTMGKELFDDPAFFAGVCCAAEYAYSLLPVCEA